MGDQEEHQLRGLRGGAAKTVIIAEAYHDRQKQHIHEVVGTCDL